MHIDQKEVKYSNNDTEQNHIPKYRKHTSRSSNTLLMCKAEDLDQECRTLLQKGHKVGIPNIFSE